MNEHSPAAATVRLRPTDGSLIGTIAFFRNRAFLGPFCRQIRPATDGPTRILAHACSIGPEAYSLAIRMRIERPELDFQIDATDLSQGFVNYAARGAYPSAVLQGAVAEEQSFFQQIDDKTVAIAPEVRARVNVLPARSFAEFEAEKVYDAVILCNALVYVDGPTQGSTIDRIAADLERNAYAPIMDDFAAIHAGWIDRQRPPGFPKGSPPPTGAQADPYIDPIDDDAGWRYRHGAFFRKQAIADVLTADALAS